LADFGLAEYERFLDRASHHDPGCPVRQGVGSGREGADSVEDEDTRRQRIAVVWDYVGKLSFTTAGFSIS
jgi:hypothetical protein